MKVLSFDPVKRVVQLEELTPFIAKKVV